jgi:hypothetical protein
MKKAALTFALISTVIVSTSFTTPETGVTVLNEKSNINPPIGASTGGGRKQDGGLKDDGTTTDANKTSFSNVSQSFGGSKKVD